MQGRIIADVDTKATDAVVLEVEDTLGLTYEQVDELTEFPPEHVELEKILIQSSVHRKFPESHISFPITKPSPQIG